MLQLVINAVSLGIVCGVFFVCLHFMLFDSVFRAVCYLCLVVLIECHCVQSVLIGQSFQFCVVFVDSRKIQSPFVHTVLVSLYVFVFGVLSFQSVGLFLFYIFLGQLICFISFFISLLLLFHCIGLMRFIRSVFVTVTVCALLFFFVVISHATCQGLCYDGWPLLSLIGSHFWTIGVSLMRPSVWPPVGVHLR